MAEASKYFLTEEQLQAGFDRTVRRYVFDGYQPQPDQPVIRTLPPAAPTSSPPYRGAPGRRGPAPAGAHRLACVTPLATCPRKLRMPWPTGVGANGDLTNCLRKLAPYPVSHSVLTSGPESLERVRGALAAHS